MRGDDLQQDAMFSYVSPERRVPADHPLRPIRRMVDQVLKGLSGRFDTLYSSTGRPSIAPEKLLRTLLLQVLYTVRSERLLLEQLDYNLLFRWFVGLNMDDPVWDATVFSKNRERLLEGAVAQAFFEQVLKLARQKDLLSDEHFTVDGTLIEAWAGQKSFQKKDTPAGLRPDDPGNPTVDFHGEKRSNQTHQSKTDPEARLYKKGPGKEAKLSYQGQVLMENRNGLVTGTRLTPATGTAEREAAVDMAQQIAGRDGHRVTVGADKAYDTHDFVQRPAGSEHHPACGPKHQQPLQRDRRAHDAACGLRSQSTQAQTGGRDLRLDQDGGADAQDATSWPGSGGVDVHLHRGGLQFGADSKPRGGRVS